MIASAVLNSIVSNIRAKIINACKIQNAWATHRILKNIYLFFSLLEFFFPIPSCSLFLVIIILGKETEQKEE